MKRTPKAIVVLAGFLLMPLLSRASNLTISAVELVYNRDTTKDLSVKMTVKWDNAWRNEKNHDAAWIVVKLLRGESGYRHALVDGM